MNNNTKIFEFYRLGFLVRKECYIIRQGHSLGDLIGCIVIAGNNKDHDPGLIQPAHLSDKEDAGLVILPITVIEVSGNQNKINCFFNRQINQVIKCPPCRPPNLFNRGIFMGLKTFEGAIEVYVCRVNKTKHRYFLHRAAFCIPILLPRALTVSLS